MKIKEDIYPNFPKAIELTMAEFRSRGEIKEKTLNNYELSLKKHCVKWENRAVDTILPQEIREVIKADLAYLSVSAQKLLNKSLKHLLGVAIDKDILKMNPFPQLHFREEHKIKGVLNSRHVKSFSF